MSHQDPPDQVEVLRRRTRQFVRDVVMRDEPAPGERLPEATLRRLQEAAREAGVFAPHVPKEYGGQGVPLASWSPILQEAGYSPIGPSVLNCMAPDEGNMHMLELIATEEQKQRFLAPLAGGEVRSCFGMTEPHPGAGSDPDALRDRGQRRDGRWLVDGRKRFTSGANGAAFCIVMARTDEEARRRPAPPCSWSPMDTPGSRRRAHRHGRPVHSRRTSPRALRDVEVGDDAILGEVGLGFRYAQVRLGPARLTH